jgi:hypothetical protein
MFRFNRSTPRSQIFLRQKHNEDKMEVCQNFLLFNVGFNWRFLLRSAINEEFFLWRGKTENYFYANNIISRIVFIV